MTPFGEGGGVLRGKKTIKNIKRGKGERINVGQTGKG